MKTFQEYVKERSDDYEFKNSKNFCPDCSKIIGKKVLCCGKCKKA